MRTHESDLPRFQRVFFLLFKEWLPCLFPLALAATHISAFWELFQWEDQLVFFAIALLFQVLLALAVRLALFLWSKSNPNTGLSADTTTFVDSQARHRRPTRRRVTHPFPHTRARTRGVSLYHQPRLPKSVTGSLYSIMGSLPGDERNSVAAPTRKSSFRPHPHTLGGAAGPSTPGGALALSGLGGAASWFVPSCCFRSSSG